MDCSSVELASIITILKNILNIVWIITPILAIVYLSVAIIKMAKDPEDKKLPKNVKNIVLALIIVFMVPTIVNALMYIVDNKTDISSCWKNTISFAPTSEYQEPISNLPKNQKINNSKNYEKGDKRKEENDPNNKNNSNGTTPATTASVQNLLKAAKKQQTIHIQEVIDIGMHILGMEPICGMTMVKEQYHVIEE